MAVGYSNGANIAGSMLLLYPEALRAALLLSPMLPLKPEQMPNLKSVAVFVAAGRADPIVAPENTRQLVSLLEQAGADVTEHWHQGGHELTQLRDGGGSSVAVKPPTHLNDASRAANHALFNI